MHFNEIRPFVRFSRYMTVKNDMAYPEFIPFDSRLFYCTGGNGKILTEGVYYEMTHGSLLIIPAGVKYRLVSPDEEVVYLALNFDYTSGNSHISVPVPPYNAELEDCPPLSEEVNFEDDILFNDVVYRSSAPKIEKTLIKLDFEYSGRLRFYENKTSAYLLDILTDCMREYSFQDKIFGNNQHKINDIIVYIHKNYMKDISNHTLAEKFHFHPNYISSIIKDYTGLPLHQYLLRVRITQAVNLLETTNMSINDIALTTGFYDCSYFARYFKKIMGKTPMKFRNNKE